MKMKYLGSIISAMALATVAAPRSAALLGEHEAALVRGGGCTVTSFSNCARAKTTNMDVCAACPADYFKCDSSGVTEVCTTLTNTAPADCISCGTCSNPCGGNLLEYETSPCTGDFVTIGECDRSWNDAQNSTCNVACGPGS